MSIPVSATRNRTRRAILSAAASVLARDRGATLADIAEAAEVGRTTLHRYFPDREELIRAVVDDSIRALEESTRGARIDEGPPLEAMRRLVAAMIDVGDRLLFLFGDPRVLERYGPEGGSPPPADRHGPASAPGGAGTGKGPDHCEPPPPSGIELIQRGQAEGVFDPEVSAEWIQSVLWALVYTGCEAVSKGTMPRHCVVSTVIRTMENGILAR